MAAAESQPLTWLEQEAAHPEFRALTQLPLDSLLQVAVNRLIDPSDLAAIQENTDHVGNWSTAQTSLRLAENDHALETLEVQAARGSLSVAYTAQYKGAVGQIIRPAGSWAVAYDNGAYYYWNEQRHEGTPSLFALMVAPCDEVAPDSLPVSRMRLNLGLGLYCLSSLRARRELAVSTIVKPNLKKRLGL